MDCSSKEIIKGVRADTLFALIIIKKPLKNNCTDVIPKQNSGFDLYVYRTFTAFLNCQILNFAEKSLFATVSHYFII